MDHWSQFYPSPADLGHTKLERQKGQKGQLQHVCAQVCTYARACSSRCSLNHLPFCSTAPQTPPALLSIFYSHEAWYALSAVSGGWHSFTKSLRTCDADLGWPLRGAIKHALFNLLHLGHMCRLDDTEHFLNELKDFWFVPLTDLHAILENHDNVLGSVLCTMFGALFSRPWLGRK